MIEEKQAAPISELHEDDQQMLLRLQQNTFEYFVYEANPTNGLVKDKTRDISPSSITAVGLGLTAYPIAVERGYLSRAEAVKRVLTTLRFFDSSEQSDAPDATGYKGFYYHFLDMQTGRRAWQCELSTIDSTFLFAGMLCAALYFDHDDKDESEIRRLADTLYRRADWRWITNDEAKVLMGWRPESGFLPNCWQGYSEALLLYVLGLGSPTHPLPDKSYKAWASTYTWKNIYGYQYLYAGPLFIHQLSHLWLDFRGIQDEFMRAKGIDYFQNSRRATFVQQQYAIKNPRRFRMYGERCWGITASDGPGRAVKKIDGVKRYFYDYLARGVPFGPDDGTLSPWAVVASLPFAPEIVIPTIRHYNRMRLRDTTPYGFKATFNPTFDADKNEIWVSPYHLGLNQGPIIIMIENYFGGFYWQLMKRSPYIIEGLRRAGFAGGWLESA